MIDKKTILRACACVCVCVALLAAGFWAGSSYSAGRDAAAIQRYRERLESYSELNRQLETELAASRHRITSVRTIIAECGDSAATADSAVQRIRNRLLQLEDAFRRITEAANNNDNNLRSGGYDNSSGSGNCGGSNSNK